MTRATRTTDPAQHLPALARAAAHCRRPPKSPLTWSEALAEAPWSAEMPAAWEQEFRSAYAQQLFLLDMALAPKRSGSSGSSGRTRLTRRQVSLSDSEIADQDARASAAGLPWATWARRKLSST